MLCDYGVIFGSVNKWFHGGDQYVYENLTSMLAWTGSVVISGELFQRNHSSVHVIIPS